MPNEKLRIDFNDPDAVPGVICKTASVSPLEVTDADLKKINKYTLSPVNAEDALFLRLQSQTMNRTTETICRLT